MISSDPRTLAQILAEWRERIAQREREKRVSFVERSLPERDRE